jgi:hypothetical protein
MLDPTQIPDHVPLGLAQTAAAIRTSKQIKKQNQPLMIYIEIR